MTWRRIHAALTVVWLGMIPVSLLTGLKQSVPFLVGISVYANVAGHFAAYQGSRAEENGAS